MKINLDEGQMRDIVSAAILQSLGEDQRQSILREATSSRLATSRTDDRVSLIQDAFRWAVRDFTTEYLKQQFASDGDLRKHLQAVIHDAVLKIFADDERTEIVESIANVVHKQLCGKIRPEW